MMTWRELGLLINNKIGGDKEFDLHHADSNVTVYDAAIGEYYPADLLVFEESDGIIDAGTMFVSINVKEEWNEQS